MPYSVPPPPVAVVDVAPAKAAIDAPAGVLDEGRSPARASHTTTLTAVSPSNTVADVAPPEYRHTARFKLGSNLEVLAVAEPSPDSSDLSDEPGSSDTPTVARTVALTPPDRDPRALNSAAAAASTLVSSEISTPQVSSTSQSDARLDPRAAAPRSPSSPIRSWQPSEPAELPPPLTHAAALGDRLSVGQPSVEPRLAEAASATARLHPLRGVLGATEQLNPAPTRAIASSPEQSLDPAPSDESQSAAALTDTPLRHNPLPILEGLAGITQARIIAQTRDAEGNADEGDRQILIIPSPDDLPDLSEPAAPADTRNPEPLDPEEFEESEDPALPPPFPIDPSLDQRGLPTSPLPSAPASPEPGAAEDAPGAVPPLTLEIVDVIELLADEQDIDTLRQNLFADGNVELRFRETVLTADRVQVNLVNRLAVAEGNVTLTRGDQLLQGDRFEYNFVQGAGQIAGARGEIFLPSAGDDFTILPTDVSARSSPSVPLSRVLRQDQPSGPVTGQPGIQFGLGSTRGTDFGFGTSSGEIRRFRFEAESVEFYPNGWQAQNVRLTNDPFSPPELELQSRQVTYTQVSPTRAIVRARNPQLVFDQGLRLPTFQNQIIIDNRRRSSNPLGVIGIDDDFGGLYVQRPFNVLTTNQARFTLSPLILLQRAVSDNNFNIFDPSSLGLVAELDYDISPGVSLEGRGVFESLDLDELSDRSSGSLRLRQPLGIHQLTTEATYRNRLFNGSLGFQRVRSSVGVVLTSPVLPLGDSGIFLSYQGSAQYITATTDDAELLDPGDTTGLASLGRFQGSAALSRGFRLWTGTRLRPRRDEGLRFTPTPITPFVQLVTGLRGTVSAYTNGDVQPLLTASIGINGQLGNFSRDFLDYTGFNITFSQTVQGGESPFRFDRAVDRSVLSLSLLQQVYGPFRVGVQTSFSLNREETIDTDYILEYSRRTYTVTLRYNPVRETGSFGIQINDFNWGTPRDPFAGPGETATVEGGVRRSDD